MLAPAFEAMPAELRACPRWVTHRAKVPFDPSHPRSKASVTDPATWGAFGQAEAAYGEGGRDGVGFVLAGDGVVGIDLDHVVDDGVTEPAALELLDAVGAEYVELSPSGTGLHAWGRWSEAFPGRRGRLDGLSVEVYSRERYLTVTGHPLPGKAGPLVPLDLAPLFDRLGAERATPQRQQKTTQCHSVVSADSVVSVGLVSEPATAPLHEGERNRALFELARRLKAARPEASESERRALVQQWHKAHYAVIRTKAFSVSWDDFERAFRSVRILPGETMARLLAGANLHAPLPPALVAKGYGPHEAPLWHACRALQAHAGDEPFFIGSRTAAELLGHADHKAAAAMLRAFVRDGVLELVSKGAGRVASRYRMRVGA
ncbi:hypothetical protein [Hydrogenophaga sp. NFH-34]|uniref:hypothetical protein n=1 Tax=Hydrogenophaga sp. NFH-34 TaxID=2744446 RepID=UPI001F2868FA|nr:hypothetical protein [Hydrogenophaga sp. NFH-34]